MKLFVCSYASVLVAWALSIASASSSSSSSPPQYVVTEILLLNAESLGAAVDACGNKPHSQSVGVDWNNGNEGGRVDLLCLRRERLDTLNSTETTHVVQRIAVYEDRSVCPASEIELYHPQDSVVVCVRRAVLSEELLASGHFISDVWVSRDRNYNSDVPGWTTIRSNVLAPADGLLRLAWQWLWTPAFEGAFITYQKPVVPIRAVRMVAAASGHDVKTASVCVEELGVAWEQAGDTYIDGEDSATKQSTKMVLCVRRGDTTESDRQANALTDVKVVTGAATPCPDDSFTERVAVSNATETALCLQWKKLDDESVTTFVLDMDLKEPSTSTPPFTLPLKWNVFRYISSAIAGKAPVDGLTGQYKLVDNIDLNGEASTRAVYLYTQPSWAALAATVHHDDDPRIANRPPLIAHHDTTRLTYKILQIADLHYSGDPTTSCHDVPSGMKSSDCSEAVMTKFVNDLLDLEKPDFVAFTGDNVQVYDHSLRQAAVDIVVKAVEERGIPHSVIFGNHDDERKFTRTMMMDMYMAKAHSYSSHGPKTVDGVGNYELSVVAPVDGAWGRKGDAVFRMYFVDSHAYVDNDKYPNHASKYDWIKPSQIQYYRQLWASHAAENRSVPAVMFFHIPLPEYAMDASNLRSVGDHLEGVQSSGVNTNLFSTLVEKQEVKATFCGHDHVNDYCYRRDGVQLCYGGGAGFGTAYGWSSVARRARVIEWEVDGENRRTIRSWRRMFGDLEQKRMEEVLFTEATS